MFTLSQFIVCKKIAFSPFCIYNAIKCMKSKGVCIFSEQTVNPDVFFWNNSEQIIALDLFQWYWAGEYNSTALLLGACTESWIENDTKMAETVRDVEASNTQLNIFYVISNMVKQNNTTGTSVHIKILINKWWHDTEQMLKNIKF